MQARPGKAASGSDLARLTAIGNLGVNARPAGFGRMRHRMAERQAEHAPPICASALGEIHSFGTALARAQLPNAHLHGGTTGA
jgi:hypothetical protein